MELGASEGIRECSRHSLGDPRALVEAQERTMEEPRGLEPPERPSWQRWWVLGLFSAFSLETVVIWNTFAPIDVSPKSVGQPSSTQDGQKLRGALNMKIPS